MNKFERILRNIAIVLLIVFGVIALSTIVLSYVPAQSSVRAPANTPVGIPTDMPTGIPTSAPTAPVSTYHTIIYKVTAPRYFSITYQNQNGDTAQNSSLGLWWNYTFTAMAGQFLYISVQNKAESGTVQCEIWVDGIMVKQTQSDGAYVIATCSGRL